MIPCEHTNCTQSSAHNLPSELSSTTYANCTTHAEGTTHDNRTPQHHRTTQVNRTTQLHNCTTYEDCPPSYTVVRDYEHSPDLYVLMRDPQNVIGLGNPSPAPPLLALTLPVAGPECAQHFELFPNSYDVDFTTGRSATGLSPGVHTLVAKIVDVRMRGHSWNSCHTRLLLYIQCDSIGSLYEHFVEQGSRMGRWPRASVQNMLTNHTSNIAYIRTRRSQCVLDDSWSVCGWDWSKTALRVLTRNEDWEKWRSICCGVQGRWCAAVQRLLS